jgi:hypothetical protein
LSIKNKEPARCIKISYKNNKLKANSNSGTVIAIKQATTGSHLTSRKSGACSHENDNLQ